MTIELVVDENRSRMLFEKIRDRCVVDDNACWNWTGALTSGYGRLKIDGKLFLSHRLIFQIANPDTVIAGLDVCHKCDNRRCCNPDHLFAGTRKDNMIDCRNKKRLAAQNGIHVPPKYDSSWVAIVISLRESGLRRNQIAKVLGWNWSTLQRYEKRHRIGINA